MIFKNVCLRLFLAVVVVFALLFYSCSVDYGADEISIDKNEKIGFPAEIKKWGESFASNMNYAIIEAEQERMSGKTNTFLERNNSVDKISSFDTSLLSFSKEELKVFKMIANARSESNSYVAFSNKLIEINTQIHKTIPKTKQENLFYITAALYYGLKEINNFAKNSAVLRGYENGNAFSIPKVRLKSGKIEDNSGESWWNAPSYLASVWAVAVVEPTPIGKAVAVVLTGIVGSYYVLTRADCIDEFVSSKLYSNNDNCADCLHYCIVQGDWNC